MAQSKQLAADSRFARPRSIIGLMFVAGLAVLGAYKLGFSSAATTTTTTFTSYNDYSSALPAPYSKNLTIVTNTVLRAGQPISVKLMRIIAGGGINFGGAGGVIGGPTPTSLKTCYILRAVSKSAVVRLTGGNGATKDVTLKSSTDPTLQHSPVTPTWQYECVNQQSTMANPMPTYQVQQISGGTVDVYQQQWFSTYPN